MDLVEAMAAVAIWDALDIQPPVVAVGWVADLPDESVAGFFITMIEDVAANLVAVSSADCFIIMAIAADGLPVDRPDNFPTAPIIADATALILVKR